MTRTSAIRNKLLAALLLLAIGAPARGQGLSFRQLDVSDGLPSNSVSVASFDTNGSLWFSTGEAINLFDGHAVTPFYWRNYPVFPRSEISFFMTDSHNRIWCCYNEHLMLIDEKRVPREIFLHDTLKNVSVSFLMEVEGTGIIAVSNKGTFSAGDSTGKWKPEAWFDRLRDNRATRLLGRFNATSYLLKFGDRLVLIDIKRQKVLLDLFMPGINEGCRINDEEILVGVRSKWSLQRISLRTQKITKTYSVTPDQSGLPIRAELQDMLQAADGKIYITTQFSGLVCFDPTGEIFYTYRHDPFSGQTVSSDNLRFLAASADGYLAITSRSGLNITNLFQTAFFTKEYFRDPASQVIDEGVIAMVEDRKGGIWVMTQTKLFIWNRETGFIKPILGLNGISSEEHSAILPGIPATDDQDRIWIPYTGYGIFIYNTEGRLLEKLHKRELNTTGERVIEKIRVLRKNSDGNMIAGSENGIFLIDPRTLAVDTLTFKPLMDSMYIKRVVDILPEGNSVWVTTSPNGGLFHYDLVTHQVRVYSSRQGAPSSRHYMLARDGAGQVYAGNFSGISVISPDGQLKVINETTGLIDHRVESIIRDDSGYMWITNFNMLLRYDPVRKHFDYFNEQNGVPRTGFLIASACRTQNGELLFGTNRGLVLVDPRQVHPHRQPLKFTLYKINADNSVERCSGRTAYVLPYHAARISFSCLNADLLAGDRIFYRYRIEGPDSAWSAPTRNAQVAYSLRPGNYTFRVQVSYNESDWQELPDTVAIRVKAPFWQQWWFYVGIGLAAVFTSFVFFRITQRSKEQKRKVDELNRQIQETRLMAIRAQMNPHFIFNSLNAIQECIVKQDVDAAYLYLSKFSKLLRQVLNNSEMNFIRLQDEIDVNRLYLELESLRFKNSFSYTFTVDENIDPESTEFPSLLLQPFIENAIWHGLMHKQGEKKLAISFHREGQYLVCRIEDNGVGRKKAEEIKKGKLGAQYFESKGTRFSAQRLKLLNETGHGSASIRIDDPENESGESLGTRITLQIPLNYQS